MTKKMKVKDSKLKKTKGLLCGTIFLGELSEEYQCGKKAVKMFDEGKPGGYPVCASCAKDCHPKRLTDLPCNKKSGKGKGVKRGKILALMGTPTIGFKISGPFGKPTNKRELSKIKRAIIMEGAYFRKDFEMFYTLTIDSDGCDKTGSHYVVSGGIADGFTACGPFKDSERADNFARTDLPDYANYEIVEIK